MKRCYVIISLWVASLYCNVATTQGECNLKTGTPRMFQQGLFTKEEFHYLNVPRVGTFAVHDAFDCTFKCLSNPTCFSANLASFKEADGKLWCELLSSDKYRNANQYSGNKSSHHFSNMWPCSSAPCQNGGTCTASHEEGTFRCICEIGFVGKYCEKAVESCKELYDTQKSNMSQLIPLCFGSKPISVLCHMGDFGCGDGGWTPVMKIDGNKSTFHYASHYWKDRNEHNIPGGMTGFDSQETKLPTYWKTHFSKICLGMKFGNQTNFIVINKNASSLYSLIADGQHRNTSLGRDTWKTLLGSQSSLQYNCNMEGFNAVCKSGASRARIGIIGNNENACHTCDSRIGFGTGGTPDDTNTCGNVAMHSPDNGHKHLTAMGYILVQ